MICGLLSYLNGKSVLMYLQTYSKEAVNYVQDQLTKAQKTKALPSQVFEVSLQHYIYFCLQVI